MNLPGCNVWKMFRSQLKADEQKEKVYSVLSSGQQDRFKNFIGGIVDVVSGINEETRGLALYDKDLFKDTNTYIKNITAGAYDSVDDFVKNADENQMNVVYRKTNHYLESVIGLMNEPRKILEKQRLNEDARKLLKFHVLVRERTHDNKLQFHWNPIAWMTAPNMFVKEGMLGISKRFEYLIHRDPMFRELRPANELKIKQEYVENSAAKFAQAGRQYVEKIIADAGRHRLFDSQMVNVLIKYMDPYQSVKNIKEGISRESIEFEIKNKLREQLGLRFNNQYEAQEDKEKYVNALYMHLHDVQKKFNKFNYGVEEPYYYHGDDKKWSPITKADLRTDNFNKAFEVNGTWYPPLLKMMLMNGEAMYDMAKDIDITKVKHDDKILTLMDWYNPNNKDDEGFKIRMNYIPSSKENDMFGDDHFASITKNDAMSGINANMLMERTKWYAVNADYTLTSLINNNLKIFKFYNSVMSDYIMSVGLDDVLNKNRKIIKNNNEPLYDSLRYYTDKKLSEYETKNPDRTKKISEGTQAYKNFMYSLIGFAVAGRLTTSAVTNRLGGFFTSMTKMSPKEQTKAKNEWEEYYNSKGIYGDIIRVIEDDEEHKAVKDKISDVIREDNFNFIDKANRETFKNLPAVMDAVSKNIDIGSDKLMNQFLGIMPKAWKSVGFSGSENAMLAFTSKFIFYDLKMLIDQKVTALGLTSDNIPPDAKKQIMADVMQHYGDHKDYYYNTIKEMIGSYSKSTKPLWQTDYMKNATGKFAITLGAAFLMHGIFKQVSANNNEALNRLYAGLNAFNADVSNPYAKGAYSSAGLGGVFMLAVYSYLVDEELNVIKHMEWAKKLPRVYSLETVNLLGEKMMTIRAMKSAIRYNNGVNLEDDDYRNLIMAGKFIGGIPLGRGMGYYEAWMDEGKYKSMKNVYNTAESILGSFMGYDPGVQQLKAIISVPFANRADGEGLTMKQRKALVDTQLRKGLFYADQSNDVLKAVRDIAIIGRGIYDLASNDNTKVTTEKFNEYVFEALRNTAGLSYYMPRVEIPREDNRSRQYNRYNKFIRLMRVTDWETKKGNYAAAKEARERAYALRKVIQASEKNVKYPNYKLKQAINDMRYNFGK